MALLAFLGAGVMGREMVLNLLAAGHQVRVYNRTRAKLEPLVAAGAIAAATPAAAAENAAMIISIVGDDAASRAVWLGVDGALAGHPAAGAIAIESSTLSPAWIEELSRAATATGLRFLDCPVTGGPDGARTRTLTLLAGGDAETLAEARQVLDAYSDRAFHFGPIGAGTAYKVMVNLMGAAQATALAEGLLIAEKAGLDMEQVGAALRGGAVASPLVSYLTQRMVRDNHDDVYFSARWRHKDAAYGLALADQVGQPAPTSRIAADLFTRTLDAGLGEKNSSVVIEILR